jgi:hypothetical protein
VSWPNIFCLFLRGILVSFWHATHKKKVLEKVGELRKPHAKAAPVVIRITDLFAKLTKEQKKIYQRAKELAELIQNYAQVLDELGRGTHAARMWGVAGANAETKMTRLAIGL